MKLITWGQFKVSTSEESHSSWDIICNRVGFAVFFGAFVTVLDCVFGVLLLSRLVSLQGTSQSRQALSQTLFRNNHDLLLQNSNEALRGQSNSHTSILFAGIGPVFIHEWLNRSWFSSPTLIVPGGMRRFRVSVAEMWIVTVTLVKWDVGRVHGCWTLFIRMLMPLTYGIPSFTCICSQPTWLYQHPLYIHWLALYIDTGNFKIASGNFLVGSERCSTPWG